MPAEETVGRVKAAFAGGADGGFAALAAPWAGERSGAPGRCPLRSAVTGLPTMVAVFVLPDCGAGDGMLGCGVCRLDEALETRLDVGLVLLLIPLMRDSVASGTAGGGGRDRGVRPFALADVVEGTCVSRRTAVGTGAAPSRDPGAVPRGDDCDTAGSTLERRAGAPVAAVAGGR